MALVHHHVLPVVGPEVASKPATGRGLNGGKQMLVLVGLVIAGEQLAKGAVLQGMAKRVASLLQDFSAVREEEQPGTDTRPLGVP